MNDEPEILNHPAFGQLYIGRVSGHANFYGSELNQDHYITLEIHQSELKRELSRDWMYHRGLPVVKIRMSSGQFSEAITSLNMGSGVPVTIEFANGKVIDKLPEQESRKEFVHRKFDDRMKEFATRLKEDQAKALALVKKKTLSKEDIRQLEIHLNYLTGEISSNIPFFAKCFQETVDEVVLEAKMEIENAIQHKINIAGLTALHEQNNLLKSE